MRAKARPDQAADQLRHFRATVKKLRVSDGRLVDRPFARGRGGRRIDKTAGIWCSGACIAKEDLPLRWCPQLGLLLVFSSTCIVLVATIPRSLKFWMLALKGTF
jgi:hypothetical protein